MRNMIRIWAYLFAVLIAASSAHGLTIPASEDTTGYLNRLTTAANASSTLMVDANHKSFLYFNLDDVPQDAVLRWAKLRLFLPSVRVKGGGLGVYLVTSQWDEALASAQPTSSSAPVAIIAPEKLGTKRFVTVDLTSTVQDWISGGTLNEGLAVAPLVQAGTALASVFLSSKEGAVFGLPAELDLEFNPPATYVGAQGPPGPQGPKGDTGPAGSVGGGAIDFSSLSPSLKTLLTPTMSGSPGMISPGVLGVNVLGVGTLSYQWLKDGVEIAGGTGATYAMGGTGNGVYSVRVNNAVAGAFSDGVLLQGGTVAAAGAVSIVSQPQGAQVLYGPVLTPNVTLSVDARSPLPIAYQWKRNGVAIAGATSGTYTAVETGTYSVIASNAVSSVTSTSAEVKWLYKVFWGYFPCDTSSPSPIALYLQDGISKKFGTLSDFYYENQPSNFLYHFGKYSNGLISASSIASFQRATRDVGFRVEYFEKIFRGAASSLIKGYEDGVYCNFPPSRDFGSLDFSAYELAAGATVGDIPYKRLWINPGTFIFVPSDMPGAKWNRFSNVSVNVAQPPWGWVNSGMKVRFGENEISYDVIGISTRSEGVVYHAELIKY